MNRSHPAVVFVVAVVASLAFFISRASAETFEPDAASASPVSDYLYDGIARRSVRNHAAWRASGVEVFDLSETSDGSFTLEAFIKPMAEPTSNLRLVTLQGKDDTSAWLGVRRLGHANQSFLAAGHQHDGKTEQWHPSYYLGSGRIKPKDDVGWRHLALVYDADAGTITCWLDYHQSASQRVPSDWSFSPDRIELGSSSAGFDGLIDCVRLIDEVVEPAGFMRARSEDLADVDFTRDPAMPRRTGVVDIREAFGAVGDGSVDDTAAFQAAFKHLANKRPQRYYTLYIPPGEYLISDEIRWSRFLYVIGAGPGRTTIRLVDQARGYGDPEQPKGVVTAGWRDFTLEPHGKAGNVIGNYLHGVSIDVGRGNPGAVALSFHSNNHGSVREVELIAPKDSGRIGLAFTDNWPGPALFDRVVIDGFDYGIYSNIQQYSLTFRDLTLRNQRVRGIFSRKQMLFIDGLVGINAGAPALDIEGLVCVVNAELRTTVPTDHPAIVHPGGGGVWRNVDTAGYHGAIALGEGDDQEYHATDRIEEVKSAVSTAHNAPAVSLNLPIRRPPDVPKDLPGEMTHAIDYESHVVDGDWAPALNRAIESGATTLVLPAMCTLKVRTPVLLNGELRRLVGYFSRLERHAGYSGPVAIYGNDDPEHTLVIERTHVGKYGNDLIGLRHEAQGALIIRDGRINTFENIAGAGDLFVENSESDFALTDIDGFFWQYNPEGDIPAGQARLDVSGGTAVVIGMKTEGKGTNLRARDGAKVELLGGYFYPNSGTGGQPSIIVDRADFSGTWRTYWSRYDPVLRLIDDQGVKGLADQSTGFFRVNATTSETKP